MGFRFRKRLKLFPGLSLNFSKNRQSSLSVGVPGAMLNIPLGRFGGTHVAADVPGTGMSWTKQTSSKPQQSTAGLPEKPYVQKPTTEEQAAKYRIERSQARPSKRVRKAARKARREQLIKEREENPPIQKPEPERKGGNGLETYYPSKTNKPPAIKRGPRGGRYTEAKTKEGRRYRRYF